MVVFGDSLSDNGNFFAATNGFFPPSPPYYQGRFSNGPIWVEHLATSLGVDSAAFVDFAMAGATTRAVLTEQVTPFVSAGDVPSDALYVLWAGPNDFLNADPRAPSAAVSAAVGNLQDAIRSLAGAGALDIVVPNMPNLGRLPGVLESGDPLLIEAMTGVSVAFNDALRAALLTIEADLAINIIELDSFGFMERLIADPASLGLTNVTNRALRIDGSIVPNPDEYLFWDVIHPTAIVHTGLAEFAHATVPEPGTVSLLGLSVLLLLSRRSSRLRSRHL